MIRTLDEITFVREPVVVRLTGSQSEPHRQTIGIDHRMYLAGQAASRPANVLLPAAGDLRDKRTC